MKTLKIVTAFVLALMLMNVTEAASLDDFEEEKYDHKMSCLNSDQGVWVVVAKKDDQIVLWVKTRPEPKHRQEIVDRDENSARYVTVQESYGDRIENLYDFNKKAWKGKTPFGAFSYNCR